MWQPAACDQAPRSGALARRTGIDNDYQIEIFSGLQSLTDLSWNWRRLDRVAESPAEQFIWVHSAAKAFQQHDPLEIITVSNQEGLLAAAPLVQRNAAVSPRARLIGVRELWEPMDLVAVDREARLILLRHLVQLNRPLHLERLAANSTTVTLASAAARGQAWLVRRPGAVCPYIPLDASWLDPTSHLNAGRRSDLRRAQRMAEKLGPVTAEILTPRPPELALLLNEAFNVEASGWKGAAGSALQTDNVRASFYRRYAAEAARVGILRLCFLRIGSVAVATQLAVETCNKFWLLKIGYLEEFQRCSPGMLLLRETIAYAAARGLTSYEFLGRDAPWIRVWTPHSRQQVSLRVYPRRPSGAAALVSDTAASLLRSNDAPHSVPEPSEDPSPESV